ncbi:MAG: helix-turn-helix domain-containing protein [Planctomycetes bacterium]|nr:helix-turn-helix domain-containing protein [Planctomycetota bacterium]
MAINSIFGAAIKSTGLEFVADVKSMEYAFFSEVKPSKQEAARVERLLEVASPYLTIEEAAAYTKLKTGTLHNAVYRGRLKKQPGSRKSLFTRADLDKLLATKPKSRR